jgi:F-type H+-transporting ATPase subunit epsilon
MAETTLFELVSPERLIISKDVSMVVVPGSEGLFGVLPRHTSMLSALVPGVIDIYEGDSITDQLFVINGFAEVTEKRCTVLAEEVIELEKLDTEGIEGKISELHNSAKDARDEELAGLNKLINEKEKILLAMQSAKNQLR